MSFAHSDAITPFSFRTSLHLPDRTTGRKARPNPYELAQSKSVVYYSDIHCKAGMKICCVVCSTALLPCLLTDIGRAIAAVEVGSWDLEASPQLVKRMAIVWPDSGHRELHPSTREILGRTETVIVVFESLLGVSYQLNHWVIHHNLSGM